MFMDSAAKALGLFLEIEWVALAASPAPVTRPSLVVIVNTSARIRHVVVPGIFVQKALKHAAESAFLASLVRRLPLVAVEHVHQVVEHW
jgi:hypothetical protein